MKYTSNRHALGGALAGLLLTLCAGSSARAQIAIPPVDPQPPGAVIGLPVPPAQSPPVYQSAPITLPQSLPELQPQPLGIGAPMPIGSAVPLTAAPKLDDKPKFDINWNNGVFFQTANKNFSFHAGATVHYDSAWYQATPILQLAPGGTGRFQDGTNMRRARFFMEGTFYEAVDYKLELEFMNGIGFSPAGTQNAIVPGSVTNSPGPTDAWITIKDVPFVGNVRIGSQKEWFSLEHLNSYRYLEFMERSYLFDFSQPTAFNNGFSPGISMFRTWLDDRMFSAIGAYKNESDLIGFGLGNGQYAVTGRLAFLPIWEPDDHLFWHLGGAMSHRDPVNGQVQIRLRDDIRNAPFPLLNLVANTGLINVHSQDLYNIETAAVWGPLTLQAEYTANVLNGASVGTGPNLGNLFFQAYYAEALLFLTGESRTWNTKNFFFNRVTPKHPLKFKHDECDGYGWGAWELGLRYTYVDLSNGPIQSGRLDAVTVGLNWYLNANSKIQFNYDMTHRGDTNTAAEGVIHAFGTRLAFDF